MGDDKGALLALQQGAWARKWNWSASKQLSKWKHVTAENGRVTHLHLHSKGLTGSIPPELGNLMNLVELNLSGHDFFGGQLTGSIPKELGKLQNLKQLVLYNNQLTGTIPKELGALQNLKELYLSSNQLSGEIPKELGQLQQLQRLELQWNQLSGSIPQELGQLQQLQVLEMERNQLTGSIPKELGELQQLTWLSLSDNQLSGSIPKELGNLSNLVKLDLSRPLFGRVQLAGTIPEELGQLLQLRELKLSGNQLSGSIPKELGQLQQLQRLELQYNQLSGSIPKELGQLQQLVRLDLENNQLSGTIPGELGKLQELKKLRLWGNQLSGAPGYLNFTSRKAVAKWQRTLTDARCLAEQAAAVEDARRLAEQAAAVEDARRLAEQAAAAEDARRKAEQAAAAEDARRKAEVADSRRSQWAASFHGVLSSTSDDEHAAIVLSRLQPLIATLPDLQFFFSFVNASMRLGAISQPYRDKYLKQGLERGAHAVPMTDATIALFKIMLETAESMGALTAVESRMLDSAAERHRTELVIQNSTTIRTMQDSICANAEAIRVLQGRVDCVDARLDAHEQALNAQRDAIEKTHKALEDFRAAYRNKLKTDAAVGIFKAVVGAVTFGLGSGLVDAASGVARALSDTVDFCDSRAVIELLKAASSASAKVLSVASGNNATVAEAIGTDTLDAAADNINELLDGYAEGHGNELLDKATREEVTIRLLAVTVNFCNGGGSDGDGSNGRSDGGLVLAMEPGLPGPSSRRGSRSGSASPPRPPPPTMELIGLLLEQLQLTHYQDKLIAEDYTTVGSLRALAREGKAKFDKALEEDVGMKAAARRTLWAYVDPAAGTGSPLHN